MWSNTNMNICYSNNIRILFEYRIIRSPLVQKPDRSCQTRVICLLIFFVLGTDLVKLGRVEQTRSNVVTVGHSQIWTSLTQLRPNWYLDRRPLASHYKNNPSQISPSRPVRVVMVILIPLMFEQQWLSFSPDTSAPRKLWLLRDNNDRFSPYNKEGALKQGEQLKLVASGHFAFLPGLKCWAAR